MRYEQTIFQILQEGPNMLTKIGKKMSNLFWKDVLCSVTLFMQGALFCNPKKIFTAPFWDNLIIQQNNKAIKKTSFAHNSKLKQFLSFITQEQASCTQRNNSKAGIT